MNKTAIEYINLKQIVFSYSDSKRIDSQSYKVIYDYLEKLNVSEKKMIIFDFNYIEATIEIIDQKFEKKSPIYFALRAFIDANNPIVFLILNCKNNIINQILERDFPDNENIFIISNLTEYKLHCHKNKSEKDLIYFFKKELCSGKNGYAFCKDRDALTKFIYELIAERVKHFIQQNGINAIDRNKHVLSSTPVHVNKYINIKPLIDDFKIYSEICFYLSENIINKMGIPDFIVAPSKNAQAIASGITRYINSNIIFLNQVSPITAYNNFSNIRMVDSNARYAVIEDFHCMGTEIKVVKGILWSLGVDYIGSVYTFPIASADIYDKDGFINNKIFPLYILENSFEYKIFTKTTCPACNKIICDHRKLFPKSLQ